MTIRPFSGFRVIDLSRLLAGPYCAQLLGDLGAEVIKVEPPSGDDSRALGPPYIEGSGVFFLTANGGKQSIGLDFSHPEAMGVFHRLVQGADVLIENFRPNVKRKLGIDYQNVSKINPRIIYCSISAFGQTGPLSERPGVDTIFQAMSGVLSIIGEENSPPTKVGSPIADMAAAIIAAFSISSALLRRERTNIGGVVEIAIRDSLIALLAPIASYALLTGQDPPRWGNASQFAAPADIFATTNGSIAVSVINDRHWHRLCAAIDAVTLYRDPAYQDPQKRLINRRQLSAKLQEIFISRSTEDWIDALERSGVPIGNIINPVELADDPQLIENQLFTSFVSQEKNRVVGLPLHLDGEALDSRTAPPQLGEHCVDILTGLGYSNSEIADLIRKGAVGKFHG